MSRLTRPPRSKSKSKTASRRRTSLRVEPLEKREMMAGDVSVSLDRGLLLIEGDNQANSVEIRQLWNRDFRIESNDNGATSINGRFSVTVPYRNVSSIRVDLASGNDSLYVHDVYVNDLIVDLGQGDDQLDVARITTRDDLIIDAGSDGNDIILVRSSRIGSSSLRNNDLIVNGNTDDQNVYIIDTVVDDDLRLYLASSDFEFDFLLVDNTTVQGDSYGGYAVLRANEIQSDNLTVSGDVDIDYASQINITNVSASDDLWVTATYKSDVINIDANNVGDQFKINARSGSDDVTVTGSQDVEIDGGSGDDTIRGGSGDDKLTGGIGHDTLFGNYGDDELLGGSGNDNLYGGGNNDRLDGGIGDDGLFAGHGIDTVTGGSGDDRFLSWRTHQNIWGSYDPDTLVDLSANDARINFNNGITKTISLEQGPETTYTGKNWTQSDIERLDVALAALHNEAGNAKLLKTASGGEITFERFAGNLRGYNSGGWITLSDKQFINGDDYLRNYVVHEIGHNWDNENPNWNAFLGISYWAAGSNPDWRKYSKATGGSSWYYLVQSEFAGTYAKNSPYDDFSESFAAYFADQAGWGWYASGAGAADIPKKITLIDNWVKSL